MLEQRQQQIDAFVQRCTANAGRPHKDNASLPAGSGMFYYCEYCDEEDMKSESFNPRLNPIMNPCAGCARLIQDGLMVQAQMARAEHAK